MTYDQWKTRSPDDEFPPEDDGPDELEEAYECLKASEFALKTQMARVIALESRIKTLEGLLLNECLTYLERHYDVVDGGEGHPAPNEAMRLGNEIQWVVLDGGRDAH